MTNKQIIPIVGIGASVVLGVVGYFVFRKNRQQIEAAPRRPNHKHSHIRKARHAHEPDYMA